MLSNRNDKLSVDTDGIVTAPTLKDAYRLVRNKYGADAIILGSRTVSQRQTSGLGRVKYVEVRVQTDQQTMSSTTENKPGSIQLNNGVPEVFADNNFVDQTHNNTPGTSAVLTDEITREVERIEKLVDVIDSQYRLNNAGNAILVDNPLAENLSNSGCDPQTVSHLLTRFASETNSTVTDRAGALTWLTDNLRASNCDWDGFYGCHAFLGAAGSGKTTMVLEAAAKLQQMGRKTLVLSVLPVHQGEVRRLQAAAGRYGYDAAIIQKEKQLVRADSHLSKYDAVLVDMPALENISMKAGSQIHMWLATNTAFHRHLIVPLDNDTRDMDLLLETARLWNCDWIAISRLDRTNRIGKIFELAEMYSLPISLLNEGVEAEEHLTIAKSGEMLDKILKAGADFQTARFNMAESF